MTNRRKVALPIAAVSAFAILLPLGSPGAIAATTRTHQKDVEFAARHPCTQEDVVGDTRVRMTIEETTNDDGTTTVTTTQHTHGQQLLGVVSQDWYTFNHASEVTTTETFVGTSGTTKSKTIFEHTSEDIANLEPPGEDDFHQKLHVITQPFLPPVVVQDTGDCK